jgi:hypothetical protein
MTEILNYNRVNLFGFYKDIALENIFNFEQKYRCLKIQDPLTLKPLRQLCWDLP